MNELLAHYRALNESFSKKLVFRIGIEAGFFSEYNNMILAMVYCLKRRIRFTLYSENAWFSSTGWTEFFEPFCREERARLHLTINTRSAPPSQGKRTMLLTAWSKLAYGVDHFTWEFWKEFRDRELEQETFIIPELGINGKLRSACKALADITWHYNCKTQSSVEDIIESVGLPDHYLGFHIRGGDKIKEDKLQPVSAYFKEIEDRSNCRNAFVLTDDYRIIETIRKDFPDWQVFSLCEASERGYYHQDFMKTDPEYIRQQTLRLFASTDILRKSELFVGTFTSNPGMYLGMRMEPGRCLGVGGTIWRIW